METKTTKQSEAAKARLNKYRQTIKHVLAEYAAIPYAYGDLESYTVFDRNQDRYLLMTHGWDNGSRVHHCLVEVDIIDGKFWVQRDGTEEGIAADLERAGVPREHIVLGFHRPEVRAYTEYAAA